MVTVDKTENEMAPLVNLDRALRLALRDATNPEFLQFSLHKHHFFLNSPIMNNDI